MVGFYAVRFEYVRVDGPLSEEFDPLELCCFFCKYFYKFLAYDLTLCLRIIYSGQLVEESVYSVNINEISAEFFFCLFIDIMLSF